MTIKEWLKDNVEEHEPKEATSKMTTDSGVKIQGFFDNGRTLVYEDEASARKKAKEMNTYYYMIMESGKTTPFFGVPK